MNKPMIADTNILIRLFVKDDDAQIEHLVQLIEQGDTTFLYTVTCSNQSLLGLA